MVNKYAESPFEGGGDITPAPLKGESVTTVKQSVFLGLTHGAITQVHV